ncbi:MAG: DUF1761 domain-containing protein [Patescibacteria group bacterium]
MESLLTNINWLSVIIGAFIAFSLGSLWFSPKMFGNKWRAGMGTPAVPGRPLGLILLSQGLGTILFAWVLNLALVLSLPFAILIVCMVAVFIKATSLFSGKSKYAIITDTTYVLAQAAIIIAAYFVFM